jgi:hypothetical protein
MVSRNRIFGIKRLVLVIVFAVAFVVSGFFVASASAATTIFNDGFQSNNFNAWTSVGSKWHIVGGSVDVYTTGTDLYKAEVQGSSTDDSLEKDISTVGYGDVKLSYWYRVADALEPTDHLVLEQSSNGSPWSALYDYYNLPATDSGVWSLATFDLPLAANNPNFRFRFRSNFSSGSDKFRLDDVSLTGTQMQAVTSLSPSAVTATYGDTAVNLVAMLTPVVGNKAINFTLNGVSEGSATTDVNGMAILSNVSLAGFNAGSYPIEVSFAGDDDYLASNGSAVLTINRADADCSSITNYSVIYDNNSHTATGACLGVSDESLSGLDLSATVHTNAGVYNNDPWTFTDNTGNYNDSNGIVNDLIAKADADCSSISRYSFTYDGNPHTATGSCLGVMGEPLSGLDLSSTTHTNAGNYTDTWTFTDVTGNYNDSNGTINDLIAKADANCSSITGYAVLYNGTSHTATGSCLGVLDEPLSVLDLSGTTHTTGGAYVDTWTFTSLTDNYNNQSGTVNDVIIAVQPPITISKKDFQNGSTIPVKIPSTISGWSVNLYACAGDTASSCGTGAVPSGGSNIGSLFRYDSTNQQYIYNLSTKLTPIFKGAASGSKYSLWITIGSVIDVPFKLSTITIK